MVSATEQAPPKCLGACQDPCWLPGATPTPPSHMIRGVSGILSLGTIAAPGKSLRGTENLEPDPDHVPGVCLPSSVLGFSLPLVETLQPQPEKWSCGFFVVGSFEGLWR